MIGFSRKRCLAGRFLPLASLLSTIAFSTSAHAETWDLTIVLSSEIESLHLPSGEGVTTLDAAGGFVTSTGLSGKVECIGANYTLDGANDFHGYCTQKAVSGDDTIYVSFSRGSDVLPGGKGRIKSIEGTGRFAEVEYECSYDVEYMDSGHWSITKAKCEGDPLR